MTVHKLSAGDGYKYYTSSIATGDMSRSAKEELGDYYLADGNPPGIWEGRGSHLLGLVHGSEVTESQMKALFGEGLHPDAEALIAAGKTVEEVQLGRKMHTFASLTVKVQGAIQHGYSEHSRRGGKPPTPAQKKAIKTSVGGRLFREEHHRDATGEELTKWIDTHLASKQQTVSGYDLTFSPPKSVSLMWALADKDTRVQIEKIHTQSISKAMDYVQEHAGYTRKGANGVRQEKIIDGLVYSRFRHYDSRTGDPQLHDHVTVANRVFAQDSLTGKKAWSTLDARELYQHNVAASEVYNVSVMELAVERLGVGITERTVTGNRPVVEIAGVPVEAIEAGSSRGSSIREMTETLVEKFIDEHGYAPTAKQKIALAQKATLETRSSKEHQTLSGMLSMWEEKFSALGVPTGHDLLTHVQERKDEWVDQVKENTLLAFVDDPSDLNIAHEAAEVIRTLGENQSVWGAHHIHAETSRRLKTRLAGKTVPTDIHQQVVAEALNKSVSLTPQACPTNLPELQQAQISVDGSLQGRDVYTRAGAGLFTSETVLAAEASILSAANTVTTSPATLERFEQVRARLETATGYAFDPGQVRMAEAFVLNERLLSTGIGPAGTGKTTTQKLVTAVMADTGSHVIGLAPSAAAAAVLSQELATTSPVMAETIDSFVGAYRRGSGQENYPVKAGDLILVDEAGMASTPLLAGVLAIAEEHGARVAFLGDDAQLAAVGAGGVLRLLAQQTETVNLEDLHRFRNLDGTVNEAEAAATLALREPPTHGLVDEPFTYYQDKGDLVGGATENMAEAAYTGWQKDINTGLDAIMMAYDNQTVTSLNARAQAYRAMNGHLDTTAGTVLSDGLLGHVGDRIVTRKNRRRLTFNKGKDFVRNGASWTITGFTAEGGIKAKHLTSGGTVTLPADYVAQRVQLGYAATIHRTQGITADTAHAIFSSSMNRSLAYVGASRGKFSNKIYTALSEGERLKDVLASIAGNYERNITAHEAAVTARAAHRSLPERVGAYNDLHAEATTRYYTAATRNLLGADALILTGDKNFTAIAQALEAAARQGINTDTLILAAAGPILTDLATTKTSTPPARGVKVGDLVTAVKNDLTTPATVPAPAAVIEDPAGLFRHRIKAITGRWVTDRARATPLGNVSDEHLKKLAMISQSRVGETRIATGLYRKNLLLAEEKARANHNRPGQNNAGHNRPGQGEVPVRRVWKNMGEAHWSMRMHGHYSDTELTTRLQQALMNADAAPQTADGHSVRVKQSWVARTLLEEKVLRVRMGPEHRAVEDHERGPGTGTAKYGDMFSRTGHTAVHQANVSIDKRITAEQIRRQRYTKTTHPDGAQHGDGVAHKDGTPPPWLVPDPGTRYADPAWKQELRERYEGIQDELVRRGAEIAANPPPWAAHLGPVPSTEIQVTEGVLAGDRGPQNRWLVTAAAVDTYRALHNVPAHETEPVPAKHTSEEAEHIRAEIVSLHKYSQQTTIEPATPDELVTRADTEELATRITETPTEAEELIHQHLRQRWAEPEPIETEVATHDSPAMAEPDISVTVSDIDDPNKDSHQLDRPEPAATEPSSRDQVPTEETRYESVSAQPPETVPSATAVPDERTSEETIVTETMPGPEKPAQKAQLSPTQQREHALAEAARKARDQKRRALLERIKKTSQKAAQPENSPDEYNAPDLGIDTEQQQRGLHR